MARLSMQGRWHDPVSRAALTLAVREAHRTPEMQAHHVALGKANVHKSIGNIANPAGSAPRMKAGRSNSERRLAWCPVEYRDEYRRLRKLRQITAGEAKAMVLDLITRDRSRARKARKFEDQLAAVAAGAKVVNRFVMPRVEPAFTLGGSVGEIG